MCQSNLFLDIHDDLRKGVHILAALADMKASNNREHKNADGPCPRFRSSHQVGLLPGDSVAIIPLS